MKHLSFGAASLAVAAFGFVPQPHAAQELNLAMVGRITAPEGVAMTRFAEEIKVKTAGRYIVKIHPGGALGGDRDLLEGIQLGTIDLGVPSTSVIANFVEDLRILDIPFLFRDFDHAQHVLDGPVGKDLLGKFQAKGLVGLAFGGIGFRQLTNSVRPVTKVEDVKGMKIRTQENQVHLTVWRAIGALPTPMALPEVFTALQQGVVDGQENPIGAIINNRFGEVQKYLSITNHAFTPVAVVLSPAVYGKLSADDKAVFTAAARNAMAVCKDEVTKVEQSGKETLQKVGVTVIDKVDVASFQKALQPTFKAFSEKMDAEIIRKIQDDK
jgi:tripartite ATP-independent transporter DctP family solute receptor